MRRNLSSASRALTTKLSDLSYRGEGNNTIVLSDDKHGVIYRFRKTSFSGEQEETQRQKFKVPKCLSESFNFRHTVIRGFLGDEFVTPMEILEVPADVLARLDERLRPDRPAFRLLKSIDTGYRNVLRAPDACRMPPELQPYGTGSIVCVEVKPKNGFIHVGQAALGFERVCKFCMVQYHPKKTKLWSRRSSYCPCDLFSGERPRMRRALKALLRNPQINFRSFLNSEAQYSCHHEIVEYLQFLVDFLGVESPEQSVDEMVELLIDGLLFSFPPKSGESHACLERHTWPSYTLSCEEGARKAFEDKQMVISDGDSNSRSKLPPDCILGRIFQLQMRDSLGVRGVHPHLQRVREHLERTKTTWRWDQSLRVAFRDSKHDKELFHSIGLVEDYLIANVAYDCSLMITLQKAKPNCPTHLPMLKTRQGVNFLLNVVVVDLDPKSFTKVAATALSWEEEILTAYKNARLLPEQSIARGEGSDIAHSEALSRSSSSCSSSSSVSSFRAPSSMLTSTSSSPAPSSPKSCRLSRPL